MRLRTWSSLCLVATMACDSAGTSAHEDSFVDEDPPMGQCESGGTGPCPAGSADGVAMEGEPCDGTNQCGEALICAAPFADGEPGALVCQASCIELEDPTAWCSDDDACCSGVCGPRGLCLSATETSVDGGTTSGGDDTSTSESTGSTGVADGGSQGDSGSTTTTTG